MIIFVDCIKNRRKDEWRDRHEPTVDVNVARPDPAVLAALVVAVAIVNR